MVFEVGVGDRLATLGASVRGEMRISNTKGIPKVSRAKVPEFCRLWRFSSEVLRFSLGFQPVSRFMFLSVCAITSLCVKPRPDLKSKQCLNLDHETNILSLGSCRHHTSCSLLGGSLLPDPRWGLPAAPLRNAGGSGGGSPPTWEPGGL